MLFNFGNRGYEAIRAKNMILDDISTEKFEAKKKAFFDVSEVQTYKMALNDRCAKKNNSNDDEIVIKVMSQALISAVNEFHCDNVSDPAPTMLDHLKQHFDSVAEKYKISISFEELISSDFQERQVSDSTMRFKELKGQLNLLKEDKLQEPYHNTFTLKGG